MSPELDFRPPNRHNNILSPNKNNSRKHHCKEIITFLIILHYGIYLHFALTVPPALKVEHPAVARFARKGAKSHQKTVVI